MYDFLNGLWVRFSYQYNASAMNAYLNVAGSSYTPPAHIQIKKLTKTTKKN
jgi:hypothetical protein